MWKIEEENLEYVNVPAISIIVGYNGNFLMMHKVVQDLGVYFFICVWVYI